MPRGDNERIGGLPVRELSDLRTLKALTHPVRVALLETLHLHGPMTATEAGEEIGESPTTCSFHLRQLQKYGFVEEAGGGKGRARPWRSVAEALDIPASNADPQVKVAARALTRIYRERWLEHYQEWLNTESLFPTEWQDAAGYSDLLLYLTPDELKALRDKLIEQLPDDLFERIKDPAKRPEGALPVDLTILAFPLKPPTEE